MNPVHITMATFAIGTIGNFDDGIETRVAYAERLQQYS
jgi:hypothetical protein